MKNPTYVEPDLRERSFREGNRTGTELSAKFTSTNPISERPPSREARRPQGTLALRRCGFTGTSNPLVSVGYSPKGSLLPFSGSADDARVTQREVMVRCGDQRFRYGAPKRAAWLYQSCARLPARPCVCSSRLMLQAPLVGRHSFR